MNDASTNAPGLLATLFFGANIVARQKIRMHLDELKATNRDMAREHSLDELIDDIESTRADGAAAMKGSNT